MNQSDRELLEHSQTAATPFRGIRAALPSRTSDTGRVGNWRGHTTRRRYAPAGGADAERLIRARFLRWIMLGCGGDDRQRIHEKGAQIQGALIVGEGPRREMRAVLNLQGADVACHLFLSNCMFAAVPNLSAARVLGVYVTDSHLPGLDAVSIVIRGHFVLRGSFVEHHSIPMHGAPIGGTVNLRGARVACRGGNAIDADRLHAYESVLLDGAKIIGEVRLLDARIGGNISCQRATLQNIGGDALRADRIRVETSVLLRNRTISGSARFRGTRFHGDLDCAGASPTSAPAAGRWWVMARKSMAPFSC